MTLIREPNTQAFFMGVLTAALGDLQDIKLVDVEISDPDVPATLYLYWPADNDSALAINLEVFSQVEDEEVDYGDMTFDELMESVSAPSEEPDE